MLINECEITNNNTLDSTSPTTVTSKTSPNRLFTNNEMEENSTSGPIAIGNKRSSTSKLVCDLAIDDSCILQSGVEY